MSKMTLSNPGRLLAAGLFEHVSAPPVFPGSSEPTPVITIPVSSGSFDTEVKASVSGSSATIIADGAKLDEIVTAAKENGQVNINLSKFDAKVDTAVLPNQIIREIAEIAKSTGGGDETLRVKFSENTVGFNAQALKAVAEQLEGDNLTLHIAKIAENQLNEDQKNRIKGENLKENTVNIILEVTLKNNNKIITDFKGGKATVSLSYTLKAGESAQHIKVWHLAADGSLKPMACKYDAQNKILSFETEHFSNFIISYSTIPGWVNPFKDIPQDAWYLESVRYVNENNIMKGTAVDQFSPNAELTRAMIVAMLHRLEKEPTAVTAGFSDVAKDKWYAAGVNWAFEKSIIKGYSKTKFGPADPATREQVYQMLRHYAIYKGYDVSQTKSLSGFKDAPSTWATPAVEWAVGSGIYVYGDGNLLNSTGNPPRSEMAVIMANFMKLYMSK